MHKNPFTSARRILAALGAACVLLLLSGCDVTVTNLTPSTLPSNPSSIYTLSVRAKLRAGNIIKDSVAATVIIDGKPHKMKPSTLGSGIFDFDYQIPAGRTELSYYFLVTYRYESSTGAMLTREEYTELQHTAISGRYVLNLEANRGPVGSRVGILGRGFTPQDVVYFGQTPARTVYESPNSISFFVPAVSAGQSYEIMLKGEASNSSVGTFRVDAGSLSVSPESLTLKTGETQTLTFTLPDAAPAGGLLLDITTDIPDSVIMPEVVVPAGSNSVSIQLTGGRPGSGSLFIPGFGPKEITVPVTVQ